MSESELDKAINEKMGFKNNEERYRFNLETRDAFIVKKGLWDEFVRSLSKANGDKDE